MSLRNTFPNHCSCYWAIVKSDLCSCDVFVLYPGLHLDLVVILGWYYVRHCQMLF